MENQAMKKLYIVGAGGHGKVVADAAQKMGNWDEIFFLDDNQKGKIVLNFQVINNVSAFKIYKKNNSEFIVAIGDNETRQKITEILLSNDCSVATVIHPFSSIGEDVHIGKGTVIMAGVVINPSTKIGKGCIINTSASVDHDCIIENYVHLSPGVHIAGNVIVKNKVWLGIGTTVANNLSIYPGIITGASANVVNELINIGTYVGNPAKIRSKEGTI